MPLLKPLKWILTVYVLLCAGFYFFQDRFFFRPRPLPANTKWQFDVPFSEFNIALDNGTVINGVEFLPADKVKGVVILFHGNRANVRRYARYALFFTKHGYSCRVVDYPGYGKSTGKMTVAALQKMALAVYAKAASAYADSSIIIYGKSLGTGVAAFLAAEKPCSALILETPYYSLSSVAAPFVFGLPSDLLMRYEIPSYQYLPKVTAPITVLHGTDDELIPYTNAVRLLPLLKSSDKFYTIPGGRHNTLASFPAYAHIMDSVMQ